MENALPNFGPRKKLAVTLAQRLLKDAGISGPPVSLQRVIEYLQSTRTLDVKRISAGEKVSGSWLSAGKLMRNLRQLDLMETTHGIVVALLLATRLGTFFWVTSVLVVRERNLRMKRRPIYLRGSY